MKTGQATASFYSRSATTSTEIPVFDPELQRLIDELDHLNTSMPLDSFCGAPEQDAEFDPFEVAMDGDERYLALYDLCGGDSTLVDTIRWANPGLSITSSATPPLVAATPSPSSTVDDFDFPAPTVGGKWLPAFHPGLVPAYLDHAPTPIAPATPTAVPAAYPAIPDPAPASCSAGPSRSLRAANNIRHRHQPYRKAAPAPSSSTTKGRNIGGRRRIGTRDYLSAYPASAADITPLQGYQRLIRDGRWSPLVADALRQIGAPYPTKGLQKLLSELYDGEGEQAGWPKEAEGRPAYPWKVSFRKLFFCLSRTVSDDTPFYRVRSPGMCV